MSKKTPATKKVAAKIAPRYLTNVLAPKPQVADLKQAAAPAPASASEATTSLPERRQPHAKRGERVALALRVSQPQYRALVEMRLDERSSIQELLIKAVAYYFKGAHGTTFPDA
jgi:hypothetical protein